MRKIVKVIFDDDSSLEVENLKPLIKSEDKRIQYINSIQYLKQFKKFEYKVLKSMESSVVERYASNFLDMICEDEIEEPEEKDIDVFSNEEILEEAKARKLFGENTSIISDSFFDRFGKIMIKENAIHLDSLLTELETKLKIIP